ncbi:MAG TPA: bifunctional nuclease family protein [Armatimonadota bacterium]|jgi:hypothetical protein
MSDMQFPGEGPGDTNRDLPGEGAPRNDESIEWDQKLRERAGEAENLMPRKLYEKEVRLSAVYEQQHASGQCAYFVELVDKRDRKVKIYVGHPEASSISMASEGQSFSRPLTHDLLRSVVERLGYRVERIIIDDLYNDTFYAKLTLIGDNRTLDIDCRPSDAIAVAVRTKAPIYIAEDVITSVLKSDEEGHEGD